MDPDAEELTFPQQSPFVATLDNLATNAFYDVAIKREASKSSAGPQWFEPVPSHIRYPFTQVRVPKYSGFSVRNFEVLWYCSDCESKSDMLFIFGVISITEPYFSLYNYWFLHNCS